MRMGRGYDNSQHVYGGQTHTPTTPFLFCPSRREMIRHLIFCGAFQVAKNTKKADEALPSSSEPRRRCPQAKKRLAHKKMTATTSEGGCIWHLKSITFFYHYCSKSPYNNKHFSAVQIIRNNQRKQSHFIWIEENQTLFLLAFPWDRTAAM